MNFENNWLTYSVQPATTGTAGYVLRWDIDIGDFDLNELTIDTLKSKAISATSRMPLGNNPYVALSGGVDSQATCLLLNAAKIDFKIAIMQFNDNLNSNDTSCAIKFCESNGFEYELVEMDVLRFLIREQADYAKKYSCSSPQFNLHFKFFEKLIKERNPSTIICGGNSPFLYNGEWIFNTSQAQNAWTTFSEVNSIPMIGNFLAWSKDIAIPLMLSTPEVLSGLSQASRYEAKCIGMQRLGVNVIPQKAKYNGFEFVKEHFALLFGDGWAFEKAFRHPFLKDYPNHHGYLNINSADSAKLIEAHTRLREK